MAVGKREEPAELADPAAAAKRATARVERVSAGLEELDRWLSDQVRGGLAGFERAGYSHVDHMAARMVDAQAPGVASMLRSIPAELSGVGWPERVLSQLASLHLLIRAHRELDSLPADLAATVRSRVGYPVSKSQVLASPGVHDRWLALGMVDTVEFRLETRRVWLYGSTTSRWALWLNFAPPGGYLDATVLPGQALGSGLHFYPGSGQYRALIGERDDGDDDQLSAKDHIAASDSFADVRHRFAELLAADPWATRMPAVVEAAPIPGRLPGEPWHLRDRFGSVCRLLEPYGEPWPLLARSGGERLRIFGEWNGQELRPLSVLADQHGLPFTTSVLGRAA
ncbi:MAG TPA: SWIM zinc finger family protein [Propionibacteriaceae bacterium]|nr:SWIM zinc finger family protein [Propionibacteriaceae bacterium]